MEIVRLTQDVTVLHGAVNMGLVRCDEGFVAVDTGIDKQAAKQLQRAAADMGLPLVAIVNTHAHADHFGGNAQLLKQARLPVFAPVGEAAVMRQPRFEPEYLWQGAQPLPQLLNKFLQAPPTPVDTEFAPGVELVIGGRVFQTVSLPGHSSNQCGVLADGVLFAADAYFDADVVDKHGVPYMVNYPQILASARAVAGIAASSYVPGHGAPVANPSPHISALCQRHEEAYGVVIERVQSEATLEDVVAEVCSKFGLNPANPGAYVLLRTPVAAYLTAAVEAGRVLPVVRAGRMWFVPAEEELCSD
ncbi:MBL fold metallo-hydrolase [Alicyclobacillus sp. ALC3]|uniref:MBL fold metallo-hydrolase n=1 Tax=Alicyclobacillus sp. ALC3 TaxID=2796143 RepID=UPI002379CF6B|nr:MBL fold metallo-hydrolase [Alicyclobacillus sp. ALC3]